MLLGGIFLWASLCNFTFAADDSFCIAMGKDIPGKFGWTTCEVFAQSLYQRLTRAGGESYYITFSWTNPSGMSGRHAIVVFRDAEGDYWGMDSRAQRPLRVSGNSSSSWARSYCQGYSVHIASVTTEEKLKGQYASLDRDASTKVVPVVAPKEKLSKPHRVGKSARKNTSHSDDTILVEARFADGLTSHPTFSDISNQTSNLEDEIALLKKPFWQIIIATDKNKQKTSWTFLPRKRNFLGIKLTALLKNFVGFEKEKLAWFTTLWISNDIVSNNNSPLMHLDIPPKIVSLL